MKPPRDYIEDPIIDRGKILAAEERKRGTAKKNEIKHEKLALENKKHILLEAPCKKEELDTIERLMPIDLEQAKDLAEYGHTDRFMAEFFNVSLTTWKRWKMMHPDFKKSLIQWKKTASKKVERALFERAVGYEAPEVIVTKDGVVVDIVKHHPPSVSACIFWLKNQNAGEWKDEKSHKVEGGVEHVHVKKEDVENRIKRLADAATKEKELAKEEDKVSKELPVIDITEALEDELLQ